jgi:hypothetical protein
MPLFERADRCATLLYVAAASNKPDAVSIATSGSAGRFDPIQRSDA